MKSNHHINIIYILTVLILVFGILMHMYNIPLKVDTKEHTNSDEIISVTTVPENNRKEDGGGSATQIENEIPISGETPINNEPPIASESPIADVTNLVLFGLDRRNPDEVSRSDTIMVITLDKKNEKIKVTSLMRDMYVPVYGKGSTRINAAYAYGDAELAIKTINANFELDIRNYASVDFIGLEKVVNILGGIEINVKDYEISEIEGVVNPGKQILDGHQVVDYCRIRHTGNADFERTERQRNVIDLLYKNIKSKGIAKLPMIVVSLLPYVETNLTKSEILDLALSVADYDTDGIEPFRLPVDGYYKNQKISGMYVLVPDLEKNKNLLHEFIYGDH